MKDKITSNFTLDTSKELKKRDVRVQRTIEEKSIPEKVGKTIVSSLKGSVHVFNANMSKEDRHEKLKQLAGY